MAAVQDTGFSCKGVADSVKSTVDAKPASKCSKSTSEGIQTFTVTDERRSGAEDTKPAVVMQQRASEHQTSTTNVTQQRVLLKMKTSNNQGVEAEDRYFFPSNWPTNSRWKDLDTQDPNVSQR